MKEELQGKLVEILTSIQTAAGKASDFALAELPDIAQSYIAYGRVWELVGLFLALVLTIFTVWGNLRIIRWMRESDAFELSPLLAVSFAPGVLGVIWAVSAAQAVTLVWFAPKVWLLKEIATLLK